MNDTLSPKWTNMRVQAVKQNWPNNHHRTSGPADPMRRRNAHLSPSPVKWHGAIQGVWGGVLTFSHDLGTNAPRVLL